jgi:hypothetical protein
MNKLISLCLLIGITAIFNPSSLLAQAGGPASLKKEPYTLVQQIIADFLNDAAAVPALVSLPKLQFLPVSGSSSH